MYLGGKAWRKVTDLRGCRCHRCSFLQELFLEFKDVVNVLPVHIFMPIPILIPIPIPITAIASQISIFLINSPTSPLGQCVSYCRNHVFTPQDLADSPVHNK